MPSAASSSSGGAAPSPVPDAGPREVKPPEPGRSSGRAPDAAPARAETAPAPAPAIDRRRYRRVLRFFLRLFLHLLLWDFLLRLPLLSLLRRAAPAPVERWCRLARRYRALAVELGGVLIKLGQYLSTRVDILPLAVTRELAKLQDEVTAVPTEQVIAALEADLGAPLRQLFRTFNSAPLGSASLAQVHGAQLRDGKRVAVKVLRPGIEVVVETDLKVLRRAVGWLKLWPMVRRRVDLDRLAEEFLRTTRNELDLRLEGANAERFARDFEDDPMVLVPAIHWETSSRRVLTMDDVGFLKISDVAALEDAGIRPEEVAEELYRIYMEQIFVHNFVHADPHPGNLFVKPLTSRHDDEQPGLGSGASAALGLGRRFQIAFIDFGMVAEIPERLRSSLRELIIGLGSRDAYRVVQASVQAGVLLPGADLKQLEEALESIFSRFWGLELGRLSALAQSEALSLWRQFGQLFLETPIQAPVDLMFTARAVELLGGQATALDPEFNPWLAVTPFAERLAGTRGTGEAWVKEGVAQLQTIFRLPAEISRVMQLARRGKLGVQTSFDTEGRRRLHRIERATDRATTALTGAALLTSGTVLEAFGSRPWTGLALMILGLATLGWVLVRLPGKRG